MARIADHESKDALDVLRHSTAHVLAAAVVDLFPDARYAIGPPIKDPPGFYYDFDLEHRLTEEDLSSIQARMGEIIAADPQFQRLDVSREEAISLFRELGQDYKVELLEKDISDGTVSIYRTGDFVDLCRGPHVRAAGEIKAFRLTKLAGAYWRGDERNRQLQRVYGTAWPSTGDLDDYLALLVEAEKRDHKRLGRELKLYALDERTGQGLVLWLPDGATIRREIERWVVDEELARGYRHVITPHVAKLDLYRQSGHYELYHDSMFPPMQLDSGEELELRPMNCPHHILVYQQDLHSYRDLPLRIAEIGQNYRYEKSGELMGMIRVRAFALNDAHIFCTPEQLNQEVVGSLQLARHFMDVLGVDDYWYRISVRDESKDKWVGTDSDWEIAERALHDALLSTGTPDEKIQVGVGEAAFYGPKIDFQVRDALRREFTNSTVQIDFQLPERFGLEYVAEDGSRKRPVMVHRGAFGSMERMIAFLIEHYAGAFPTWLAPLQVIVLPITDAHLDYARQVAEGLRRSGLRVEVDDRSERMPRKIRDAQARKIPYMAVVGKQEVESGRLSVRDRAGERVDEAVDAFASRLAAEVRSRSR